MRNIRHLTDVIEWNLCTGCGACFYMCEKQVVQLVNIDLLGIRPKIIDKNICEACNFCLEFCPGAIVDVNERVEMNSNNKEYSSLIGSTIGIYEGFAVNEEIRYVASSGGIITALALYCLNNEGMKLVLHTAANNNNQTENISVQSKTYNELISRAGSRYLPSSPCDSLKLIESSDRKCVFIGKPCDVSAVSRIRKIKPELDEKIGLVLSFFCAGTPSTKSTLELIQRLDIAIDKINEIRYRGKGWPGRFNVKYGNEKNEKSLSYEEAWGFLSHFRPLRCHLCPDGLGELSDITCGDGWHRYNRCSDVPGNSYVLVRSSVGEDILSRAISKNYVRVNPLNSLYLINYQHLINRRKDLFGRLLAMRLLLIPVPKYKGFKLVDAWKTNAHLKKMHIILATLKRIIKYHFWKRNKLLRKLSKN